MATNLAADKWANEGPGDLPKGMKKELLSFLKRIAMFQGDLSSLTAPNFLLSTTSMAEYPAYWAEQPMRFAAPAKENDSGRRALKVLTWFLTTLKQQYDHRKDRKRGKPLNPVLGELFLATLQSSTHGNTQLVSEQVSHHPPVTAYKIWNEDAGISLSGYHLTKTFFANRMIHLYKVGQVLLKIDKHNEDHLITFPQVHLEGFLPPPPFPEFDSNTPAYICSSSGYITKITFSGKGWLRGKRNSFVANLCVEGRESEPLYTAEGQWSGIFTIKDARTNEVIETYDSTTSVEKLTAISVPPIDEQDPMESRRLWGNFAAAMERRDMGSVSAEKTKIEVRERDRRKAEEREGRKWETRYFSNTDIDPKIASLGAKLGLRIEPELTAGFWTFDEEKYKSARRKQEDPFADDKAV